MAREEEEIERTTAGAFYRPALHCPALYATWYAAFRHDASQYAAAGYASFWNASFRHATHGYASHGTYGPNATHATHAPHGYVSYGPTFDGNGRKLSTTCNAAWNGIWAGHGRFLRIPAQRGPWWCWR